MEQKSLVCLAVHKKRLTMQPKKNLIHKNNAARKKSRIAKLVNDMKLGVAPKAQKTTTSAKPKKADTAKQKSPVAKKTSC